MSSLKVLFAAFGLLSSVANAQVSIADFESGVPVGWTTSGTAWTVGGTTGGVPTPQGALFARSGAPNALSGPLAESLTGTLTSTALTVGYESVQWISAGWSGQFGNGLNRFEILDQSFAVKATIAAPLSDFWSLQTVNLVSSGLAPGSIFYFRAIDGASQNSYAWLAVDDIKFIGAPVPEPGNFILLLGGVAMLSLVLRTKTGAKPTTSQVEA